MPHSTGEKLGPYELLSPLGEGGMGEVWKARDTRLGREVAIKFSKVQFTERFEREARTVAALNHPHICTLHDVGPDYLVMEYIAGEPLRGPMPVERALPIAADIAGAIDAAHRKGIIHRDLKPSNILIAKSGVKLLDFGLAKMNAGKSPVADETVTQAISREGSIAGTLQYMAPEQLQGHEADARSDIFGFGCVLYELLGGRRAFSGKDPASVIASILKDEPPPVRTGAVTPKPLDRLVRKCLAKDPDARWQSASDLRDELLWIAAEGASGDAQEIAPKRQSRTPWLVAAVCAMLAVAAFFIGRGSTPAQNNRVVRFPLILPDDAAGMGTISPDGGRVLFYRRAGAESLSPWIYNLESGSISQVPNVKGLARWLPDGRGLLFQSGRQIMRTELAGGPPVTVGETEGALAAWAPGGFLASKTGLTFIASTGQSKVLTQVHAPENYHFGSALPDGKHFLLLAMANGGKGELRLGSFDGSPEKFVMKCDHFPVYALPGYLLYIKGETLVAHRFDPSAGVLSGLPQTIAERVTRPANTAAAPVSVSQNGVLLYRHGSRYKETTLTWYDRNGAPLGTVGQPADYSNPALSPDQTRLAVAIRDPELDTRDIWIFDLERGGKTRLTFDEGDDFNAVWSPDGSRIAYSSQRKGNRDLYIKSAGGAGEEKSLLISNVDRSPESWSSDGRYLSYDYQAPGNDDLHFLPMDSPNRTPIPFRATRYTENRSKFSPDGRLIAYRSDESGRSEVFVQTLAPEGGRWQISTDGGTEPDWRGDGQELYYVSNADELMAVDIQRTGDKIRAGVPKKLFPVMRIIQRRNRYVVARDGKRFLAITALPEKPPEPPTVVINWPALLKEK